MEHQNLRHNYEGYLVFESSRTDKYYDLSFSYKRQIIHVCFIFLNECMIEISNHTLIRKKGHSGSVC